MLKAVCQFTLQRRCLCMGLFLFLYLLSIVRLLESILQTKTGNVTISWPLDMDIKHCVNVLKSGGISDCPVINSFNYSFLSNCETKCKNRSSDRLRLMFIVKSKLDHFKQRLAIRQSWGSETRFPDVSISTVFIVGVEEKASDLQTHIEEESKIYGDVVQANFVDSYWNNTVKTMMALQWAVKFCNNSRFYVFADDDVYVSTKNVLRYLTNPFNNSEHLRNHNGLTDSVLPWNVKFYAGRLGAPYPHRNSNNKWYVPESEYPPSEYPRFIVGACYFLSFNALRDLYFGSFFTKYFRIDDVFLGLVAEKMGVERSDCNEIYRHGKPYYRSEYQNVIAVHGYDDPNAMLRVWGEQASLGFA